MAKSLCRYFAAGRCQYGKKCKFSHDTTARQELPDVKPTGPSSNSNPSAIADLNELLKKWRFMLPTDKMRSRPLGDTQLATFFERALELVDSGSEHMQKVVVALATEEGLTRIRELLDKDLDQSSDSQLEGLWQNFLLPYFRLLSHKAVLQAMVVESRHATLLNDMYGDGGRGAKIFRTVVRCLTASPADSELDTVIAVLAYMLERNSSAKVNTALQVSAEALVSLLDLSKLTRASERYLRTITTVLKIGIDLPQAHATRGHSSAAGVRPTFTVAQDLPGTLSEHGARHDNDSDDIRRIRILPTREEIHSARNEYLPLEDPAQWHRPGLSGLIDRHFRLLREDTVGQLRDAARIQLQALQTPAQEVEQTTQGSRINVYHSIVLHDVDFHDQHGLLFTLAFDQPTPLQRKSARQREEWWTESRRLAGESLVCLLSSDGHATFLVVHVQDLQHNESPPINNLHRDARTAYVVVKVTSSDPEATVEFLHYCTRFNSARCSLVEFPGVLLPTFAPTLAALQDIAGTLDVPFANFLVPSSEQTQQVPPAYARRGATFTLKALLSDKQRTAGQKDVYQNDEELVSILAHSCLDETQQKAVKHALSSSLALVQGPPGTGKSFTGVKIIQALLDNQQAAELGPIICVCFTNHALDQLLGHLVDAGVQQVIRIGSRSKSERLQAVNLRHVARQYRFTKTEGHEWGKAKDRIGKSSRVIGELLSRFSNVLSRPEQEVMALLRSDHPGMFTHITNVHDGSGWIEVRKHSALSPMQAWLQMDTQQYTRPHRPLYVLLQQSEAERSHGLSRVERRTLYQYWVDKLKSAISEDLQIQLQAFNDDKETLDAMRADLDLRVLSHASVIGVTTSGLARNVKLLRKLTSKVLVVEEAGEVLEAHLLTAMLPSLEHAILIGDHQQLRPKCSWELSIENPASRFALDVSLFERLVTPRVEGTKGLNYVTLETQRRMHPSISSLIRNTIYPRLEDGESVKHYRTVVGMRHRLFWLDHSHPEDSRQFQLASTSQTNKFEVELIAALVNHLQRQGVYSANEIAIITPYLGQLRELKRKLGSFVGIILNDRDVEELAKENGEANEEEAAAEDALTLRPSVAKGNLLQALRLATVDNFQGEEAKVVIVSLVRSNDQHKCGFLRTPNRIGVLLSRAQHGMYIIGNSQTSIHVPMWHDVVSMLESASLIGRSLELSCPRHPDTPLQVTEASDFARVSPEAGCDLMCGKQLQCGHSCPSQCHADSLHNAVHCLKDCTQPKKGCIHACKLVCGDECETRCDEAVECDITLDCGHRITGTLCWQYQDQSQICCQVPVERDIPGCGHKVELPCNVNVNDENFACPAKCSADLDCGHNCRKKCSMCSKRGPEGQVVSTDHGTCKRKCGRDFTACNHSCSEECHGGGPCKPCSAPCEISCAHSRCAKLCNEPCTPCTEEVCSSSCPHSTCHMPCGAPCDWVPCSKRCERRLECGHQCPSVCGEICPPPSYCQLCASDEIRDIQVDVILMETYGETDLNKTPCLFLPCGHVFSIETMDGLMEISTHYDLGETTDPRTPVSIKEALLPLSSEKLKTCPNCRGSLRSLSRYGRIVRRAHLDNCTLKFITWSHQTYIPLAERLQTCQAALLDNWAEALISGNVRLQGTRGLADALKSNTGGRYKKILTLRRDIVLFLQKVRKEEQPFQRVHDLVEARRRRSEMDVPQFAFDQSILQTRSQILAQALQLRCDLIIVTDLVTAWDGMSADSRGGLRFVADFGNTRKLCSELFDSARKSMNVLQQSEANIFWAQFAALECVAKSSMEGDHLHESRLLREEANQHLEQAEQLCQSHPGQTASVASEIDGVRKMLKGAISEAEMRMVVGAMQQEFSGTGHWYRCVNGHPFTVGECGMPMQQTRCPQCDADVGGQNHSAAAGVTSAGDIERDYGNMNLHER